MVVVHREAGLRFVIFKDDHEPAHVHVLGDGDAKIRLFGDDGLPKVEEAKRMKRPVLKRAKNIVKEQQFMLMNRWKEIHG
jgi:hypothetical protein